MMFHWWTDVGPFLYAFWVWFVPNKHVKVVHYRPPAKRIWNDVPQMGRLWPRMVCWLVMSHLPRQVGASSLHFPLLRQYLVSLPESWYPELQLYSALDPHLRSSVTAPFIGASNGSHNTVKGKQNLEHLQ